MRFAKCALVAVLASTINLAHAAGVKQIEVPVDGTAPALKAVEWSPCASTPDQIKAGPFILPGVRDCPVVGKNLPLIVISHGFGGTSLGHHDTAEALADAGFIVVALNHPDDTAGNKERYRNLKALISRPTDVSRIIDFMLGSSLDHTKIDPQSIGFFGFSRGGYTGLVLAGAKPDFRQLRTPCKDETQTDCNLASTNELSAAQTLHAHDSRIKAFVVADPLSSVFPTPDSLKDVTRPIQLWRSQYGGAGVTPENVAAVAHNLPVPPDFQSVFNAAHFAFLTICPDGLAKAVPELCVDQQGFDRAAFHKELNTQVITFFRKNLPGTTQN